jgi:hypothetical protein
MTFDDVLLDVRRQFAAHIFQSQPLKIVMRRPDKEDKLAAKIGAQL